MTGDPIALSNSVVRIPVAGPAPNNTLVYVRAQFPSHLEVTEGGLARWSIHGLTLYRIDGFSQAHADEYVRDTRISVAAWMNSLKNPTDQPFIIAIDTISASVAADGTIAIDAQIANQGDDFPGLVHDVWVSAYILTKEPQRDFTRPPIRWSRTDMITEGAKRGPNYTEQGLGTRRLTADEARRLPSPFSQRRIVDHDCH